MQYQHQILIASYAKDFHWLRQCLRSLTKFSTGFLPPVVAVPGADHELLCNLIADIPGCFAQPKVWNGEGFGRAQSAMMHGDILCGDAHYYWLLGSDCFAVEPFSPANYCDGEGKPFMLFNTWEFMQQHAKETLFWRAGTEKALGVISHGEFMRRLPLAYPSDMLMGLRLHVERLHGLTFHDYVQREVNSYRNFSESNVMGEWAWRHCQGAYNWVNLDGDNHPTFKKWPASPVTQFWSHGGIDRPRDGMTETPRETIIKVLGSL